MDHQAQSRFAVESLKMKVLDVLQPSEQHQSVRRFKALSQHANMEKHQVFASGDRHHSRKVLEHICLISNHSWKKIPIKAAVNQDIFTPTRPQHE